MLFKYLRLGIFGLFFFLPLAGAAQNSTIDSLKSLLGKTQDIVQFDILYDLTFEYVGSNELQQSLLYIEKAQNVASRFGDSLRIVKSGRVKAQILRRLDRTSDAINEFNKVLEIARRNNLESEYKYILNGLAVSYTFQANYDKALEFHFKSLLLREKEGNNQEIAVTLNNIGLVYFKLKSYQKALGYYFKALDFENKVENSAFKDKLLINIGLCYNQMTDFSKAQKYINEGLKFCSPNCHISTQIDGEFGLGVSFYGQGKNEVALKYFEKSYELSKQEGNKRFQLENLVYLSRIFTQLQKGDQAMKLLQEAESLASDTDYNQLLIEIYKEFSKVYNQIGDFKNAASYQNKYIHLKDSIYSDELIQNLASIQTDFAQRENKAIIASNEVLIKQQRDLNFAIAIIAILAGLLILVLQRSNRVTKQVNAKLSEAKQIIEEQNNLLEIKNKDLDKEVERKTIDLERVNLSLKQVNDELDNFIYKTSHDIRGPLASLKGMCNVALMDVKDPIALDYLRKLDTTAERLNTILTRLLIINQINNSKLSIAKIDFTSIVNDVLLLEKKKGLPQKLKIRNTINGAVSIQSDKELVRIVLENLIDNAIKFYNDSQRIDSFVEIQIVPIDDGGVKVRVIDNGIGISESNPGKLFQMFFRASERSEIGGIGLYIVKTATSKLGGRVGLLTTPEGYTEFYVTFPAYPSNLDEGSDRQDFY